MNIVSARAQEFAASALILFALVVPTVVMAVVVIDELLGSNPILHVRQCAAFLHSSGG